MYIYIYTHINTRDIQLIIPSEKNKHGNGNSPIIVGFDRKIMEDHRVFNGPWLPAGTMLSAWNPPVGCWEAQA